MGVSIEGRLATGYRLRTMPDLLMPDVLAPLLKGTIFNKNIHHYYKIGSTNTTAMEADAAGAVEGTVFIAEQQSAGRGRGANTWHSEQSTGIYCSVILRPALPPSAVLVLTLATGLAVHAAVQQIDLHLTPDLKWPNDGLLHGKKFCGILTEMIVRGAGARILRRSSCWLNRCGNAPRWHLPLPMRRCGLSC